MVRAAVFALALPFAAACSGHPATPPAQPSIVAKAEPTAPAEDAPGLDVAEIRRVVEAKDGAVRGCHTIEYSGRDGRGGTMTVDLAISPSGAVESAVVVESDFDSEPMQACIVDVTRGLRFPEAPGATEVSWRFKFRAPQG